MVKVGCASRNIVPDRPAMLHGQMHVRIARTAMDPITLTALALEGGSDRAILISADLVNIPDALHRQVQERVAAALPGVAPGEVLMAATHTHTSLVHQPGPYPQPPGDVMTPQECAAFVADRAVQAAVEAWQGRGPGTMAAAFGRAVVGHNRRPSYADGHSRMYGPAGTPEFRGLESAEDHSLGMVFFWDAGARLAGILLCVPCPSQVDEGLEVFSADYWHDVRTELRARLGPRLWVLPLCGAAGDVSPHFILDGRAEALMRARRGVSERREIAVRIADEVQRALACTTPDAGDAVFRHGVSRVGLSPRRIARKERDEAAAIRQKLAKDTDPALWWPTRLRQVVEDFDSGRTLPPVPVELHFIRLGDAVVATNPFELYTDYALRIRGRSTAALTLVVQLAAGAAGYLPTQRGVDGGRYGAMPASCTVGPEGGQELVEHSLRAITEMFPGTEHAAG